MCKPIGSFEEGCGSRPLPRSLHPNGLFSYSFGGEPGQERTALSLDERQGVRGANEGRRLGRLSRWPETLAQASGEKCPSLLYRLLRDLAEELVDDLALLLLGQRGFDQAAGRPDGQIGGHPADL